MERVVLDVVYLLGIVVLALVVGLVGRGVEKLWSSSMWSVPCSRSPRSRTWSSPWWSRSAS